MFRPTLRLFGAGKFDKRPVNHSETAGNGRARQRPAAQAAESLGWPKRATAGGRPGWSRARRGDQAASAHAARAGRRCRCCRRQAASGPAEGQRQEAGARGPGTRCCHSAAAAGVGAPANCTGMRVGCRVLGGMSGYTPHELMMRWDDGWDCSRGEPVNRLENHMGPQ
jgi:hypothetical protein